MAIDKTPVMKHKANLLTIVITATTAIGTGACSMANSPAISNPSTTVAQESGSMNHGGMNHGDMKQGGMNHNMDIGPANANYDLRFLDSMIPHHQGALVMAKEVLAKSKRPELIKLAKTIIADQTQEIAQMQQWRKQWYPKASATPVMWHAGMNGEMPMTAEYKQMMQMNMSLGEADAELDRRFLDAMTPHHQGAVTMGKDALQKSKHPELQKLAKNIISSQQKEIDMMTQLRNKLYPGK
jgi:uncharacterized protein (DUF305 family)